MPGARWFPGAQAQLRRARPRARGPRPPAPWSPSTRPARPRAIVAGGAARPGRRARRRAARPGRRAGRPRRRLPAEHPRGGRRPARRRPASARSGRRCAPDFGTASVVDRFAPDRAEGADRRRRLPLRRQATIDRRTSRGELRAALPSRRAHDHRPVARPGRRRRPAGRAACDELVAGAARARRSSRCRSTTRCGSCSPRAPPACRRASSTATAASCSSTSSASRCSLDLGAGDRFFCYTLHELDDVELPGRRPAASARRSCSTTAARPTPTRTRLWRVAATTRRDVLGTGAGYVCALRRRPGSTCGATSTCARCAPSCPTGSPLPPAAWPLGLRRAVGRDVRLDSICGGTDVCTALLRRQPAAAGPRRRDLRAAGSASHVEACDDDGRAVIGAGRRVRRHRADAVDAGEFWNDPDGERYRDAYFDAFPGVWRQGDWITITERGGVVVLGPLRRDAEPAAASGWASADIYAVVEALPEVADSLVVGVELPDGGYCMPLFVVLADGAGSTTRCAPRIAGDAAQRALAAARARRDRRGPRVPRTLTGKKLEVPSSGSSRASPPEQAAASGVARPARRAGVVRAARTRVARGRGVSARVPAGTTSSSTSARCTCASAGAERARRCCSSTASARRSTCRAPDGPARRRELIAFDLPGTGRSSLPRLPMGMKQTALTVARLVRALGHERVDVLGYSFGGAVAQELAYRAPSCVRRLILCATTAGPAGRPPEPARRGDDAHAGALLQPAARRLHRAPRRRRANRPRPRRPRRGPRSAARHPPTCSATASSCPPSRDGAAIGGCTGCAPPRWSSTATTIRSRRW